MPRRVPMMSDQYDHDRSPTYGLRHAPGPVSGTACAALWAIFLPATIVCTVALGYKAATTERITLPNLLVWAAGLVLVVVQMLLLAGVTRRYMRGRRLRRKHRDRAEPATTEALGN